MLDQISIKAFRREYPKATIVDFSGELSHDYPQWIKDKYLQIAEYWRVEKKLDELIQFQTNDGATQSMLKSKLEEQGFSLEESSVIFPSIRGVEAVRAPLLNSRSTRIPSIIQYITNGVEILEKNKWLGKWIPIVPLFGKELYITETSGSKRMLLSLIRNARDGQMSYNYVRTCITEAIGRVPKSLFIAAEGQFEGHEQEIAESNQVPKGFIYYKPLVEGINEPLPPPQFQPFDPPVQNLEIAAESFSRGIQSAVGMYNSSVGRNDTNVKSGKAIDALDEQSDLGSFHFIANYNRFITRIGEIVNDLVSKVENTEREVPIKKQDGTEAMVRINTAEPYMDDKSGEMQHYPMELGEYDVTIGVQPNADSQRDEASDFIETFIQELPAMNLDPAKRDALIALAIKIKQMGPIADQMVDVLQPEEGDPQQLQAQLAQLQQQVQELGQENEALHLERAGKVLEQQTKLKIEQMKGEHLVVGKTIDQDTKLKSQNIDRAVKLAVALITAKDAEAERLANALLAQMGFQHEASLAAHDTAHEVAHSAIEHGRAIELADKQAAIARDQQTSDQQHQQTMAEQATENQPA